MTTMHQKEFYVNGAESIHTIFTVKGQGKEHKYQQ